MKRHSKYTYIYTPEMYKYILNSNLLNKKKDEHKIFKSLVEGWDCTTISIKYHYSEKTIHNRRKEIYEKTKRYMV